MPAGHVKQSALSALACPVVAEPAKSCGCFMAALQHASLRARHVMALALALALTAQPQQAAEASAELAVELAVRCKLSQVDAQQLVQGLDGPHLHLQEGAKEPTDAHLARLVDVKLPAMHAELAGAVAHSALQHTTHNPALHSRAVASAVQQMRRRACRSAGSCSVPAAWQRSRCAGSQQCALRSDRPVRLGRSCCKVRCEARCAGRHAAHPCST